MVRTFKLFIFYIMSSLLFTVGMGTAQVHADSVLQRLGNSYQYVSDSGVAVFNIPWRGATSGPFPGVSYDGNLAFWTEPGTAGTATQYGKSDTVSTTSVNGTGTLPAYAADGSSNSIGTWILPTGNVPAGSSIQVKLVLSENYKNFAGVIRPLKVSLSSSDPAGFMTYLNSGSSTFYPLTLTSTADSEFYIDAAEGTPKLNFLDGSYLNTSSQPSPSTGETTMGNVLKNQVYLVNDDNTLVTNLDMKDSLGNVVGTWSVSSDGSSIGWTLNGTEIQGPIQKVKYSVEDVRSNSWSGWWSQLPTDGNNVLGGPSNYDIAYLIPSISNLVVHYQDVNGNELESDVNKFGYINQTYTTEQKEIPGYTFKEVKGNASGSFAIDDQTVTYVYIKNPVAGGNVTAKYVDENGNKISDPVVKSGNVGDEYSTEQKEVSGYTFKEVQGNVTGTFTADEQTVTYVYTKNPEAPEKPVTPASPEKPVIPDNGKTGSTTNNNTTVNNTTNNNVVKTVKKAAEKMLPKTAAEKVGFSTMLSIILAGVTGIIVFKSRRNKQ
ncbi:hypothetical protein EFN48_11155 [Leuconostoc pseudomesenteroides]|nr:hypothetical protein [Leuconostoc pseudomesenteroides]